MNLAKFPKRTYTVGPTALHPLPNFQKTLPSSAPQLWIKRDDQLGLTMGGNKTRKLEFLVADALAQGADTLITCGAIQSNHCRLTLSAAVREGLKCQLVLEERVEGTYSPHASGNNFLYHLLGAEAIVPVSKGTNLTAKMNTLAEKLKKKGRMPYIIPGGGSNEIGALGYVNCAQELIQQCIQQQVTPTYIVTTSGSSGTHAGLLVGIEGTHANIPIVGISVMKQKEEQTQRVYQLAQQTANKLQVSLPQLENKVTVHDQYIGDGYAIPTPQMITAVSQLATTEGILLDPVYTGKAFSGLLDLIHQGAFTPTDTVIFIHTGGSPALFAYHDLWTKSDQAIEKQSAYQECS